MRLIVDDLQGLEPALLSNQYQEVLDGLEPFQERIRKQGLWAPAAPRELGGMGLTLREFARVSEVLGRSPLGHLAFHCMAPDPGNVEILHSQGSEQQRADWLEPLVAGQIRSCFAMTEPGRAGSNPTWMDTVARREGDEWIIDGRKWFTTGAQGAAFTIVMAVTEPEAESRHARASMIIVPMDTPGLTRVRNISVMGEEGFGPFSHAELNFEACRVPFENLLGSAGAGFAIAQERLGAGRIHHCMRWIGICERAFELMARRAASRELRPGHPLSMRDAVRGWIADSRIEINAARLLVMDAVLALENHGASQARLEISAIKVFAAGVLQRVLDRAIQTHGALGVTDDTPIAWWYRHERAARIYDGADEVHRAVVARESLRRLGLDTRREAGR